MTQTSPSIRSGRDPHLDFKQIIQVLRRRWMTIALLFVIAVGAASAYTFTATEQSQSNTGVFVSADTRSHDG